MKTIALVLFAAISAVASPIGTGTLTLTGVNGQSVGGDFVSPYYATLGSQSLVVYCDDVLDSVSTGQSWPVDIYAGTNTAGALFSPAQYSVLFWLAAQDTPSNYVTTQLAMWRETDPSFAGTTSAAYILLSTAIVNAGSVNLNNWDVLKPVGGTGQEFIVDAVSNTPEPISGVLFGIGLIGVGVLRRKV